MMDAQSLFVSALFVVRLGVGYNKFSCIAGKQEQITYTSYS